MYCACKVLGGSTPMKLFEPVYTLTLDSRLDILHLGGDLRLSCFTSVGTIGSLSHICSWSRLSRIMQNRCRIISILGGDLQTFLLYVFGRTIASLNPWSRLSRIMPKVMLVFLGSYAQFFICHSLGRLCRSPPLVISGDHQPVLWGY